MLHIEKLSDGLNLFKALGSDVRLEIVRLLVEQPMNMNELAGKLHITNGALTTHIRKLEECGVVAVSSDSGGHGNQKICQVVPDKLLINVKNALLPAENTCSVDLMVGRYCSCRVYPTCGLSTTTNIIGELDVPRVFSYPERFRAGILWFGYGSVTYNLPNRLSAGQTLQELQISFEISSECPEINEDYPSDIYFDINGIPLGKWISPGDFGSRKGILSPYWWPELLNQYGLLKTLIVNSEGTFIDGTHRISRTTIQDLHLDYNRSIDLTFSVPRDTANCGGLTLFGGDFGDYKQDIRVKAYYDNPKVGNM